MKKYFVLLALFTLLGGVLFDVSYTDAEEFPQPSRTCTSKEIGEGRCRNQPTPGQTYMFSVGDYCRQGNTQTAKTALSFIKYQKVYDKLEGPKQTKINELLDAPEARSPEGLVPCGRSCDDPTTAVNEAADCAFCHFFVLLSNIINWILKFVVTSFAALIGGFILATSRGNPGQSQKGKDILIWTFAGLAVIFVSWIVVNSLFTGLGVTKWTGLRGETGTFEDYTPSRMELVDRDRTHLSEQWDPNEWRGFIIELEHSGWSRPQTRKITRNSARIIRIDEALPSITPGEKINYKIGGWWLSPCGLDGFSGSRVVAGIFEVTDTRTDSLYLYVGNAGWTEGYYSGYGVRMKSGISAGEERTIVRNGGHFLQLDAEMPSEQGDEFEIFIR